MPGTNINHNYLRDLATPRNPGSDFTFPRYLSERGRLFLHGEWSGAVGRIEWSDYVSWAAGKLSDYVHYNQEVSEIVLKDCIAVVQTISDTFRAKKIVLACGMEKYFPEMLEDMGNIVEHADSYLYYRDGLDNAIRSSSSQFQLCIIGGGLSAGEIAHDLLSRHDPQNLHITSIQRDLPFKNYNMSSFTSQIYMPPETSRFFAASPEQRREAFLHTYSTNFSGVDVEFSDLFWNFLYERALLGIKNYTILDRYILGSASKEGDCLSLALNDCLSKKTKSMKFDKIIAATGYADTAPYRLLNSLKDHIIFEGELFSISEDYKLLTESDSIFPIWLNGHCEHTHGISDTQSFSLVAYKAGQMMKSIFDEDTVAALWAEDDGQICISFDLI